MQATIDNVATDANNAVVIALVNHPTESKNLVRIHTLGKSVFITEKFFVELVSSASTNKHN
jgi:hypothetical protein